VTGLTALVLAGSRGPDEPVARAAGVTHKALAPVGGNPIIARVLRALAETPGIGKIVISTELPDLACHAPAFSPVPVETVPAAGSPSLSVKEALESFGAPLLVTTADHALLRPEWVSFFLDKLQPENSVTVALARSEAILAAAPGTRRTFFQMSDGRFSSCNLFHLADPSALGVVGIWREVERARKEPIRIIRLLGPMSVARYALSMLSLEAALNRLGRITGACISAVEMPFGESAIDVDSPADLELAEKLIGARRG
jgi:GTP:adenosylcobinamide-phosphate guanylyltransferase